MWVSNYRRLLFAIFICFLILSPCMAGKGGRREKNRRKNKGNKHHRNRKKSATTTDELDTNSTVISLTTVPLGKPTEEQTFSELASTKLFTSHPADETTALSMRHKTVVVRQGRIRGRVEEVLPGKNVNIYLGVKYGEAPTGLMRFKHPVRALSWNGTEDALQYSPTCHQWRDLSFESYRTNFTGTQMWNANTRLSEDCLYLNVWAPENKTDADNGSLAVMVWIYGGGYYSGTSSLDVYNGKWLAATQNVVVVSMNYRIGALGFLSTGEDDLPGNAGLFDQRLALEWVRDNIAKFGGDPNKVTLFGESAGAASIALHMMSEGSKGLFRNVILQSASALSPWSILTKEEARRRAIKLARAFDCITSLESDDYTSEMSAEKESIGNSMMTCLRKIDPQQLVHREMELEFYGISRFPNAPVVDGDFLKHNPNDMKHETYLNKDVNVLAGYNANEGNYFLVYTTSLGYSLTSGSKIDNRHFKSGIKQAIRSLDGIDGTEEHVKDTLASASHFAYTQGQKPLLFAQSLDEFRKSPKYIDGDNMDFTDYPLQGSNMGQFDNGGDTFYRDLLDDLVGDISFVCPTIGFLDVILQREMISNYTENPNRGVYLYNFLHRSTQNPWPEWMGVMHGYEIEFVFGLPLDRNLNYTDAERNISKAMMEFWGNFAKHGNPNGEKSSEPANWPLYNNHTKFTQVLGDGDSPPFVSSLFSSKYRKQLGRCAFWRDYFPAMQESMRVTSEPTTCAVTSDNGRNDVAVHRASAVLTTLLIVLCSTMV